MQAVMMGNGNVRSGLTTENHLGYLYKPYARFQRTNEYGVRARLIEYFQNKEVLSGIILETHISNFDLINRYLSIENIETKKLCKLKHLLDSSNENDYLLLMGLISNIFKNK